jgi:VWFA-related protein
MTPGRLVICGAIMLGALVCLRPFPLAAQFRSGTSLVEVDVVVLDGEGRFVPGLQAGDLTLFEDGRPQKIEQFYMVTYDPGASVVSEYADKTEHTAQRVFVVLFDEGHLANDSLMRVKRGAEAFIREQFGARDIGGVFVDGGMYTGRLTTDRDVLVAGIRSAAPAFDNRQGLLAPFRDFPRVPSELDAVRIADGGRETADALAVEACRENPQECVVSGGVGAVENLIERKSRDYVRQARRLTAQTLQNLRVVARGLSRIPGRKTVVLLSEGFFVEESRGILERIAAEAARAGTVIYSIDGRGLINPLRPSPDAASRERPRTTGFDTGEDGPNILTAGTGGFRVRGIDDMSRAFGLIARDTSTYYVIGYQPDNAVLDGKFRKIEVKSRIAGRTIRARKGYAAVPLPPPQTLRGGR